jgi:hypothetical protein
MLTSVVIQIIDFTQFTLKKTRGKKSVWAVMQNQGVTVLLLLTTFIVDRFSPSDIVHSRGLYFFITSLGLIYSKITLHIQIAHLGSEHREYEQFRKSYVFVCLAYITNIAAYYVRGSVIIDEYLLAQLLTVYALIVYVHTCTCVSLQLSKVLGIKVLKVKPK